MANLSEKDVAEYWNGNAPVWTEQVRKGFDAYRELINNPKEILFLTAIK